MRVLGVDPGLVNTGYGVIEVIAGQMTLLHSGTIVSQIKDGPLEQRLKAIHEGLTKVFLSYWPHVMALEDIFSHHRYPQSSIILGHARGVISLVAAQKGIPVYSYPPTLVKETLTGDGRASKYSVQRFVQLTLNLSQLPSPSHVADALALAIAHSYIVGAR